jgi:hypothetical protein
MTTGTLTGNERFEHSEVNRRDARARAHLGRFGLGTAGVLAVLVSAWGGIVPYIGPSFNFSGDGTATWHWSMAHAVLALVPGAAGVLLGLFVIAEARGVTVGKGRLSLATAGTLLMITGAWFATGSLAWPVISNTGAYFVASTHLRVLAYEVGYSIGVGLVLVFCGAFVDGWAARHQPKATVVAPDSTASGAMTGPVETGI